MTDKLVHIGGGELGYGGGQSSNGYEHETPLQAFKRLGMRASYHYADDTTKEWGLARKAQSEALKVFDANPDDQVEMRKIAQSFLWAPDFKRLRPE